MHIDLALALVIAAVVVGSASAAASLDQLIKQLPTRRRIGPSAYSTYSRVADLEYGLRWYLPVGGAWAVLVVAAAIAGWTDDPSASRSISLGAMVLILAVHGAITGARAAPIVMSQREVDPQDGATLGLLFDRFERWHRLRCVFDVLGVVAGVWALVATIHAG